MFRFSLRSLLLFTLVVGVGLGWYGRNQAIAYREAAAAKSLAELRWREWQSATNPTTTRERVSERHARLRYLRDRQAAADNAEGLIVPITLPPP